MIVPFPLSTHTRMRHNVQQAKAYRTASIHDPMIAAMVFNCLASLEVSTQMLALLQQAMLFSMHPEAYLRWRDQVRRRVHLTLIEKE